MATNRLLLREGGITVRDRHALGGRELQASFPTDRYSTDYIASVVYRFVPAGWKQDSSRPWNVQNGTYTLPIKKRERGIGR